MHEPARGSHVEELSQVTPPLSQVAETTTLMSTGDTRVNGSAQTRVERGAGLAFPGGRL